MRDYLFVGAIKRVNQRIPTPMDRARKDITVSAKMFGITPEQLLSPDRTKIAVMARTYTAHRMRHRGLSYPQVGRYLNRDHTSIVHLINPGRKRRTIKGA